MTGLWRFIITAELDDEGDVCVDYEIEDTVSVSSLVGHLEIIKHRLIADNILNADEEETE